MCENDSYDFGLETMYERLEDQYWECLDVDTNMFDHQKFLYEMTKIRRDML